MLFRLPIASFKLLRNGYSTYLNPVIIRRLHAEHLKERNVICVEGKESEEFLQGLVTNDMSHLSADGFCIYAMFLNVQGRVLFDVNIFREHSSKYLIDCDQSLVEPLMKHLNMFKVRKKINVTKFESMVWSIFEDSIDSGRSVHSKNTSRPNAEYQKKSSNELKSTFLAVKPLSVVAAKDPRLECLGYRFILPTPSVPKILSDVSSNSELSRYKLYRYQIGIGEGPADIVSGKTLPLESNCDYMHGVSFQKGCYIGQELTARSFHTGVIRKRIMPIIFKETFDSNNSGVKIINENGQGVGKVINTYKEYGLGLLKIVPSLEAKTLTLEGSSLNLLTYRPSWWPVEAPKEKQSKL